LSSELDSPIKSGNDNMAKKRFHTLSTFEGSFIQLEIYATSTPNGNRSRNGDAFDVWYHLPRWLSSLDTR